MRKDTFGSEAEKGLNAPFTRRTVLAGMGGTTLVLVSNGGSAATDVLRISRIQDPSSVYKDRQGLEFSLNENIWELRPGSFGPRVRITKLSTNSPGALKSVRVVLGGDSLLSPDRDFSATFSLEEKNGLWELTFSSSILPNGTAPSGGVPLDAFMVDGGTSRIDAPSKVGPEFKLTSGQSAALLKQFFGYRVEALRPLSARYCKDGSWTLFAETAEAPGRGGGAARHPIVVLKSAGFLESLRVRVVDLGAGPGASLPEFAGRERGATGDAALLGTGPFHASGEPLVIAGGEDAPLHILPKPIKDMPMQFALRHDGDAKRTMAILRGPFQVRLVPRRGVNIPEACFELRDGLVTRQRTGLFHLASVNGENRNADADRGIRHRLKGIVAEGDQMLETPYGTFSIRGDQVQAQTEKANALGADLIDFASKLPPTGTMARMETFSESFTTFEVRALVTSYDLTLQDPERDEVWSRLDFTGTEVAFVQARLHRSATSDSPLNAAGIVELGVPPTPGSEPFSGNDSSADAAWTRPQVELSLDGARLMARRAPDLLALNFQFVRLALQVTQFGARIVPEMRRGLGHALTPAPDRGQRDTPAGLAADTRARLIVTFPPQHIAERAYWRRLNEGISLPDISAGTARDLNIVESVKAWRGDPVEERAASRSTLQDTILVRAAPEDTAFISVAQVLKSLQENAETWKDEIGDPGSALHQRWLALPRDQQVFLGLDPQVIDYDVRAVIFDLWRARTMRLRRTGGGAESDFYNSVRLLPEGALDPEVARMLLSLESKKKRKEIVAGSSEGVALLADYKALQDAEFRRVGLLQKAILSAVSGIPQKEDDAAAVQAGREIRLYLGTPRTPPDKQGLPPVDWSGLFLSKLEVREKFTFFAGREHMEGLAADENSEVSRTARKLAALLARVLTLAAEDREAFMPVTPARLSGPSRLVFHVDGGYPPAFNDPIRPEFPSDGKDVKPFWPFNIAFTLRELTNWGRFDLAVTRRAERLYLKDGGRLRSPMLRQVDGNAANILGYQGVRPGRTAQGRLDDISRIAAIAPAPDETAIELPYRLILSPSQEARFYTPHPMEEEEFFDFSPPAITSPVPRVESLWGAALEDVEGKNPDIRAVASPDFRPEVFSNRTGGPVRGPWAPWVPGFGETLSEDPEVFRSGLDAYDRHELVGLTSVPGLPVLGRFNAAGQITDPSQFAAPEGYRLPIKFRSGTLADQQAIYRPQALGVSMLRLTSLGGSLGVATDFVPPSAALDADMKSLFPDFSIQRWRQNTVLGRDIEVEVVYKGFLFPLGLLASLTKLTERRFVRYTDPQKPGRLLYGAYLVQRFYVNVANRTKRFHCLGQPDDGRQFPCQSLTMLTIQTPDILDPDAEIPHPPAEVSSTVQIAPARPSGALHAYRGNTRLPGRIFWPRSAIGEAGNIPFEFEIDGQAGAVCMPLIFVDNIAANNRETLEALADYYNGLTPAGLADAGCAAARTIAMGNLPRRYAQDLIPGDCSHETYFWDIRVHGRPGTRVSKLPDKPQQEDNDYYVWDSLLQSVNQPPFYPRLESAVVRIGSAERFLGRPLPAVRVKFTGNYTSAGFDAAQLTPEERKKNWANEVYLEIDGNSEQYPNEIVLQMGDAGDRGGGIARPAIKAQMIGRGVGLVACAAVEEARRLLSLPLSPAHAGPVAVETRTPEPPSNLVEKLFSDDAKLLGLIKFKDLLTLGLQHVPELKEVIETATGEISGMLKEKVIPRIEAVVIVVDQAWENARSSQPGLTQGLKLEDVYPDIGPALVDLKAKLARTHQTEDLALVVALNEVAVSARRFIQAVERVAADPITPLKESLRTRFRDISRGLEEAVSKIQADLEAQLFAFRTGFRREIETQITQLLKDKALAVFRSMLVTLPVPPDLPTPLSKENREKIGKALDDAIGPMVIECVTKLLASETITSSRIDAVFQEGIAGLKASVAAQVVVAEGAVKEALEAYLIEISSIAVSEQMRRLKGPLFDRVLGSDGWVHKINRAQARIAGTTARSARDFLQALGLSSKDLLAALGEALATRTLAEEPDLNALCANLASQLHTLTQAAAIQPKVLDRLRVAAADYVQLVSGDAASQEMDRKFQGIVSRYNAAVQVIGAGSGDVHNVCTSATDLPAAAIFQALREKQNLLDAVRDVVCDVVPAPGAALPDPIDHAEKLKSLARESVVIASGIDGQIFSSLRNHLRRYALAKLQASIPDDLKRIQDIGTLILDVRIRKLDLSEIRSRLPVESADKVEAVQKAAKNLPILVDLAAERIGAYEGASDDVAKAAVQVWAAFTTTAAQVTADNIPTQLAELRSSLHAADMLRTAEERFATLASEAIATADRAAEVLNGAVNAAFNSLFSGLSEAFNAVIALRKTVHVKLAELTKDDPRDTLLVRIIARVANAGAIKIQDVLIVREGAAGTTLDNDGLAIEADLVGRLANSSSASLATASQLAHRWGNGDPAVVQIGRQLSELLAHALRGDLSAIVDLQDVRRQMEMGLRDMIPQRISRSYTLDAPVDPQRIRAMLGDLIHINEDQETPALKLSAGGTIDLAGGKPGGSFWAQGSFPSFSLKLLPAFDVVTLTFAKTTFAGGSEVALRFSSRIVDVKLGEQVKFLEKLQNYLSSPKDGSGFFLRVGTSRGPGILAGYGIALAPISIGNMYISNVSLSCAAELPFGDGDARFLISCGRPDAPLLISAAPYAGVGYFGIIANPRGIVGFEASFEFGGGGGFSFGLLKGEGRVTVGIFVRQIEGHTTLYGLFFAGGSARISCFSMSTSLSVRLSQQPNGDLMGRATFAFSFSIGITDFDYVVTVEKYEKGSSSSSRMNTQGAIPSFHYAALAPDDDVDITGSVSPRIGQETPATLVNTAVGKGYNWAEHNSYFDFLAAGEYLL